MQIESIEVIIVEDDLHHAQLSISALQENNIMNRIIHLKNGAEALDYLFRTGDYSDFPSNDNPKVLVLDLKMPVIGGVEVLRRIKTDEKTKDIPVIVFTSSTQFSDERECYSLGAKDYIIKPREQEKYKNVSLKIINGLLIYASQILVY